MDQNSMQLARRLIGEYYSKAPDLSPRNIGQREFGFGDFERKITYRHLRFGDWKALKDYMVANAPPFVSISAGFYKDPAGRPMENKGLLGAELVFDLDANDLNLPCKMEHGPSWVCGKCLGAVKAETTRLVEEFLVPDFGFSQRDIRINFSGNRGYHIHVDNDTVFALGNDARKEISNYITARGMEMGAFFPTLGMRGTRLDGPKPTDQGWGGKLARGAINALNSGTGALMEMGIDKKTANLLSRKRAEIILGISNGNWDKVSIPKKAEFWKKLLGSIAVSQSDSIDQNVSTDTGHLIRLPDTIHGDTGLLAKSVGGVKDLEGFDPMRDAIALKGERIRVKVNKSHALEIGGERFGPYSESVAELPAPAAIYLILKRVAEIHA